MKALREYYLLGIGVLLLVGPANASLVSRLSGQAVYDTDLNITWLVNANLPVTNTFGVSGINANGQMTWTTAGLWVAAMNTANYLGVSDWRLPTTTQPDPTCSGQQNHGGGFPLQGVGWGCTGGEMGHLFYTELGGAAGFSIGTTHNANYNLFTNIIQNGPAYWSGTDFAPDTTRAWFFTFDQGYQNNNFVKNQIAQAWAVRPGDIGTAVPMPGAVWLMSGALSLLGLVRRKALAQSSLQR